MKTKTLVNITFYTGIASIFLWTLSIFPILAIVFGIITLIRLKKEEDEGNWVVGKGDTWLGLALGIVFLIVRLLS